MAEVIGDDQHNVGFGIRLRTEGVSWAERINHETDQEPDQERDWGRAESSHGVSDFEWVRLSSIEFD